MQAICNIKTLSVIAALIASAAIAGPAAASQFVGDPGAPQGYDRVITISPDTTHVNVANGETVKFVDTSTGQSFVWQFDTPNWAQFDLAQVAPANALGGQHVQAFVAAPMNGSN